MSIVRKNIKSPKDLFEEKRIRSLLELEQQRSIEMVQQLEKENNKRLVSPKSIFGEEILEEVSEEIEEDLEDFSDNVSEDQIALLKFKIEKIENSISEEVDLTEVWELIDALKKRIDNISSQNNYREDIEKIREELVRIERSIPIVESFDPSNLYENINLLSNKIKEVRSEIPTVPDPILYDDQIEELKSFIENVRISIPDVPEIKYYDEEIKNIIGSIYQVREDIKELPEVKYYDNQIEIICERLDEIQKSIPEVKYYDSDIESLETRISEVKNSIPTVPEVKYYDGDIENLQNKISEVKNSIPTVPEVKYYDSEIESLETRISEVKNSIPTVPEVKYYDEDIKSLNGEIQDLYEKVTSIKVSDEDNYRNKVKELQEAYEEKNIELWEKIKNLEEIIDKFSERISLEENLSEPPDTENTDPLTPLDKNFVTLDQLQNHYKLFINRIQQQLSTIGGGGETRLKYLDDIVGIATNASAYDGKFLKYNHSIKKFEFVTVSTGGGGGTGDSYWIQSGVGIVTTTNVGVKTDNPTSTLTVNGDALVVGILTATDFNSASDIKLKENVSVIGDPIDKIVQLEGVNFQWKETGKKSLGVIAQEVEKVLPELVSGEESKTVNYNGIIGLLIECVKQQQKEIEDLKKYIHK